MRSSGYNKIVDTEPPAMPARKDDMGDLIALGGFCCVSCWGDDSVAEVSASVMVTVTMATGGCEDKNKYLPSVS